MRHWFVCWLGHYLPALVASFTHRKGLIMSDINYHPSFEPVQKLFAIWDKETPTPDDIAREHLKAARQEIKFTRPENDQSQLIAQSWGVVPRGARRTVLSAAGLDPEEWERPIHSFSATERAAMAAAARAAVRVYERAANAI